MNDERAPDTVSFEILFDALLEKVNSGVCDEPKMVFSLMYALARKNKTIGKLIALQNSKNLPAGDVPDLPV